MQLRHACRYGAIAAALLSLTSCATGPEPSADEGFDARLGGPCDRLTVGWQNGGRLVQQILAGKLTARRDDALGALQLNVLRCGGADRPRQPPLMFAYMTVPVEAGGVPVVITSIPDDGWYALSPVIADGEAAAIFAELGYDVVAADIALSAGDSDAFASARLRFDTGQIVVQVGAKGAVSAYRADRALLASRANATAVFFGAETASQRLEGRAAIRVEGETPFEGLRELGTPTMAASDTDLLFDRIYWLVPDVQR